jgi:hypothetical protein
MKAVETRNYLLGILNCKQLWVCTVVVIFSFLTTIAIARSQSLPSQSMVADRGLPESAMVTLRNNTFAIAGRTQVWRNLDVSNQINQTCSSQATANSFTITRRGGLPLTGNEILSSSLGWVDWRIVKD